MFKLLKKYYKIDKKERIILNQTFFWLIYAFVLVRIIPLKWFSSVLGEFKKEIEVDVNENQLQLIDVLRKNKRRLKKRLPWKVKCFEEAIAVKKVLEKHQIKSTIYLGVSKDKNSKLIAHAWLKIGSDFISGKKGYEKFSVVGFYS
ncbi:MAG: lasso peptide biosynthesis B2 protein [Bacteroidales bacterium]|nr:lasso peptide biosynthesis B2 protein [Bacteroidales bacterium]